ncbi:MAG TPA: YfcE family phosphodiesterase [Thermomicrobiales bacterium]
MKIGILSDIHDNIWNLRGALAALRDVDAAIVCGDLCSPFVIGLLAEGLPDRPIHIVFGNNDGDLFRIAQMAAKWPQIALHGEAFVGDIGGKRFFVNHYPAIARATSPADFDVICYGHDHRFAIERRGTTMLINPGPTMGYIPGGPGDVAASFVVYDTDSGEAQGYRVDQQQPGGATAYPAGGQAT